MKRQPKPAKTLEQLKAEYEHELEINHYNYSDSAVRSAAYNYQQAGGVIGWNDWEPA